MRTSRFEYFGAIWEGIKAKKPVKSTFYRLLSDLSSNSADRTGLEPATSAVTGRHSNQLNYRSLVGVAKIGEIFIRAKTN
jgi:hypothetical protein